MSEQIKHECGIALIRFLKPIEYYYDKYGSWDWGLKKLYLLMEKQHNRGQDGAGLISVKMHSSPGKEYIHRVRSNKSEPIKDLFKQINIERNTITSENYKNLSIDWVKDNMPFVGEIMMGHLRYGTFGKNDIDSVHPVLRRSNWKSKTLALQGNFNLTNVDEIFQKLLYLGQHPREYSDTITVLEKVGHFLDEENEAIFRKLRKQGLSKQECSPKIQNELSIKSILSEASEYWDGGYAISGIIGHGDAFVIRDPWGIRPAYYFQNDEVVVVASERPVIQTVFKAAFEDVHEMKPGCGLIIKRNGDVSFNQIRKSEQKRSCSFERIYFSRGSDKEIYNERKNLGKFLVPQILEAIDYDLKNSVFSYIPNTAETAFLGMIEGLDEYSKEHIIQQILKSQANLSEHNLRKIISEKPRVEKLAIKDIKLRTFITQDNERDDLVEHVYDVTYGIVKSTDNLIVIDDSIVRGTTLKKSIIKILSRLEPKRIIIVSSAPQIRYPDCYGIDMAYLEGFVAFKAVIDLLKESGQTHLIEEVYNNSIAQKHLPKEQIVNYVKDLYRPFTAQQVSDKIAQILTPQGLKPELKIIYQSIENLHRAIPNHTGDWYFTGNFPTPGGNKVVNTAFINYYEGKIGARAY
ncbi:MAG: amidophosphoribosyltransferase [Bacteroidales bacterium]|nr:amidophosphoribosyltransferase [Bacteroidales bacterium]